MFSPRKSVLKRGLGSPSALESRSGGAAPLSPLVELRQALDRIEAIIEKSHSAWESSGGAETKGNKWTRNIQRRSSVVRKTTDTRSKTAAVSSDSSETDSSVTGGSSPRARRRESIERMKNARFITIDSLDEEELVELLRRTAELVVTGEKSAAIALSNEGNGMGEADRHLAIFELFCERNALSLIVNIATGAAFSSSASSSSSVTSSSGASGTSSDSSSDTETETETYPGLTLLPPLTVANQSIQSVSILVQNVSRATSLYFLLSNNRVNDLINFPLELYAAAEKSARGGNPLRGGHECSPEMGELSACVVSFLKSLALRVNAETLQFFLTYPPQQRRRQISITNHNKAADLKIDPKSPNTQPEECPDENSHASAKSEIMMALIDFPLSTDDEAATSPSENGNKEKNTKQNFGLEQQRMLDPINMGLCDVEFPLYARALEFCSSEQDGFVRVTAMNICLNMLRLASQNNGEDAGENSDINSEDSASSSLSASQSNPAMLNTPDGILHNKNALPLKERVAIARHVCDPGRVVGLVSPIFTKLAGLCGDFEETVRVIDTLYRAMKNDNNTGSENERQRRSSIGSGRSALGSDEDQKRRRTKDKKKQRQKKEDNEGKQMDMAVNKLKDLSDDLQSELLLLEDVLKVGLTSLNEQAIEMMMATFIYPILLQPLLYLQSCSPLQRPFLETERRPSVSSSSRSSLNGLDPTQRSEILSRILMDSQHPFSVDSLSTALARSGLLNERRDENDKNSCHSDEVKDNRNNLSLHSVENGQSPSVEENILDIDLAPAKTAYFGLAAVFHSITHKPLLRLLLTALFHPLAPVASDDAMICSEPDVIFFDSDGKLRIRVDGPSSALPCNSCVDLGSIYGTGIYCFGKTTGKQSVISDFKNDNGGANIDSCGIGKLGRKRPMCTFVLSPALAEILNGAVGGISTTQSRLRENPYRRIALACLAGTDGMLSLRSSSIFAIDAALSVLDSRSTGSILFGNNLNTGSLDSKTQVDTDPANSGDAETVTVPTIESRSIPLQAPIISNQMPKSRYMVEVMAALCISVMTASSPDNGTWRLDFDQVAADALLNLTKTCSSAATIAANLLDHRRLQSASFVSQLPSMIHLESLKIRATTNTEDEEKLNVIMDRIFFDKQSRSKRCAIEMLSLKRKKQASNDGWYEQFCVPVTMPSSLDRICAYLCKDPLKDSDVISSCQNGSLQFATLNIFSHFQLDAYAKLIKDKLFDIDGIGTDVVVLQEDGSILAHLSPCLCASILERGENGDPSLSTKKGQPPKPGSSIELIGRAAFPCVCEVSESQSSLFSSHGATVSEGVTWQSLYLVVVGKYMILAEPDGSSEGNGRIVMSCRLSCLKVEKDKPVNANNGSTACRLMLSYASHDSNPPGIFFITQNTVDDDKLGTRFTLGRLDVWFEDAKSAGHAFKVLALKILKAKSDRGSGIRDALTFDDQLQTSSLFSNS